MHGNKIISQRINIRKWWQFGYGHIMKRQGRSDVHNCFECLWEEVWWDWGVEVEVVKVEVVEVEVVEVEVVEVEVVEVEVVEAEVVSRAGLEVAKHKKWK